MLTMRITDLKERATEVHKHLRKIDSSCEAMDGNTSNAEEECLVETIKEEMPDKLD